MITPEYTGAGWGDTRPNIFTVAWVTGIAHTRENTPNHGSRVTGSSRVQSPDYGASDSSSGVMKKLAMSNRLLKESKYG